MSENNFPSASGIASSSSAFASITMAACNAIGYEINKSFLPIIENKIEKNKPSLFGQKDIIEVIHQNSQNNKKLNNNLLKTEKNKKTINNRVHHPEYWKGLKSQMP